MVIYRNLLRSVDSRWIIPDNSNDLRSAPVPNFTPQEEKIAKSYYDYRSSFPELTRHTSEHVNDVLIRITYHFDRIQGPFEKEFKYGQLFYRSMTDFKIPIVKAYFKMLNNKFHFGENEYLERGDASKRVRAQWYMINRTNKRVSMIDGSIIAVDFTVQDI